MKPIQECSKEEIMERALSVIEGICMIDSNIHDPKFQILYQISHVATQQTCSRNNHANGCGKWLELIEDWEKELKLTNIL